MRTRSHHKFNSNLAFLDMLFNMVLAFSFLFILAMLLIKPTTTIASNVQMKAEFILTMSWPDEVFDDVDLWVALPSGATVNYLNKNPEFATLDRDDRGVFGDLIDDPENPGFKKIVKMNREIVSLRAIVPGKYIVSAHSFAKILNHGGFESKLTFPYEVKLEMMKLNPVAQVVATATVVLEKPKQEKVFFSFVVEPDGTVSNLEMYPALSIVQEFDIYQ